MSALRPRISLPLDIHLAGRRPEIEVVKHNLRPAGRARLDALVATPADPVGVLVYFPGFNTPLGPWETAKCQYLAQATSMQVVLTEIPGMSRYGDPIPRTIRAEMLRGRIGAWAELNLAYIRAAIDSGWVVHTSAVQALGYSTGCSLATAALPALAELGPIQGLNLVEPVAISRRNLASLEAHNMLDFGRTPLVLATNLGHNWVMHAYRTQRREPSVKYGPADLLAIATVLSGEDLSLRLGATDLVRCALARGSRSSLCRRLDFEKVDASLQARGVGGPTITVEGLGHQLWHSFPVVTQLIETMLG